MIPYEGFNIDPVTFEIYNGSRKIFTAFWQRCSTLEQAKLLIDTSNNKSKEQMRNRPDYGSAFRTLLKTVHSEEDQFREWMEKEHDKQLNENI